jgi:RimJ/RimL family protein N-acetyltransferase
MALLRDGMQAHELKRVIGLVQTDNAGSARVLQKMGLRFERKIVLGDRPEQFDLYAITIDPRQSGKT